MPTGTRRRRVGAYALCETDGSVLLTQLWQHDPGAGRWTLPGGGMDFGEHPEETVLRELHEETGLAGSIRRLIDIRSQLYPPWRDHGALQAVQFIYLVDASGEPRVMEENGSTIAAAWIPLAGVASVPMVDLARHALRLVP